MRNTLKNSPLCLVLAMAMMAAGAAWAAPGSTGMVAVTGQVAKASRGFPSVVILIPDGGANAPVPEDAVIMDQIDKEFRPGVLVARVGQTVTFRNSEAMLHNVHLFNMANDETVLNVAQPMEGQMIDHVFEQAGANAALCDVHPEMEAYVVVVDTPYATVAAADGNFEIQVPAGTYTLEVWSVNDKKRREEKVHVGAEGLQIH